MKLISTILFLTMTVFLFCVIVFSDKSVQKTINKGKVIKKENNKVFVATTNDTLTITDTSNLVPGDSILVITYK